MRESLTYPTMVTEMRSFLGFCILFMRLVPNFARIDAPLNDRLKKGESTRFQLDETSKDSVDNLKRKLTSPLVLALPRIYFQYTVDTDACDLQVWCILLQYQREIPMRPIGYCSRSFNKSERS